MNSVIQFSNITEILGIQKRILNLISEWNKVVKKYEVNASIADLRQIKDSIEPLLGEDVKCKTFMPDFMTEE